MKQQIYNIYIYIIIWGSLCNCRHPGPRRVWDGGSEPRILPPLPRLPRLPWLPWRIPKTQILLLYAVLESSRPPSEIWFEQPSITFGTQGLILNNPPSILKDDPWGSQILAFWEEQKKPLRARQNQILAFWEKKAPAGTPKRTPGFDFQKR